MRAAAAGLNDVAERAMVTSLLLLHLESAASREAIEGPGVLIGEMEARDVQILLKQLDVEFFLSPRPCRLCNNYCTLRQAGVTCFYCESCCPP